MASARLEINRAAGMEAMQAVGIDIPPYTTFNSLEGAEAFARKSDRAWVFKPMGVEEDKSLTYVSKDRSIWPAGCAARSSSARSSKARRSSRRQATVLCKRQFAEEPVGGATVFRKGARSRRCLQLETVTRLEPERDIPKRRSRPLRSAAPIPDSLGRLA